MANYCAETDIEALLNYPIDATSRPTTTSLAVMITNADGIINGFARQSTNMTDTYGLLKPIACQLVMKMINNMLSFAEPEKFDMMELTLTDDDKDNIIKAHSLWEIKSWEMGIP